jgi:hypothetical protein
MVTSVLDVPSVDEKDYYNDVVSMGRHRSFMIWFVIFCFSQKFFLLEDSFKTSYILK